MGNNIHVAFKASDRSYFAILKKEIHTLAVSAGFESKRAGEVDIVVAEMVSNLAKHANEGRIIAKLIEESGVQGIEIISMDEGPGMTDINRMMSDGFSTKNTLGHGLGTMKRMSDLLQIYSQKESGTIVLARLFVKELPKQVKLPVFETRSLLLPKPGEEECGDGFFYKDTEAYKYIFLGDGLGHGPDAAKAVTQAGLAFLQCTDVDPVDIIRFIHAAVKKTRGLVGTVAVFDVENQKWRICGVGNISTRIVTLGSLKNHSSYNGIIGLNVPNTLNSHEIKYEKGQHIIMCSDGLRTRWDISKYPGIFRYDLSMLCAVLIKDQSRNTDDMSAVCCKINI